jgi:hypothetical protein
MTKDTALDLALEALELAVGDDAHDYQKYLDAITAIKQALAAPVQEPVACQYGNGGYACCEGGPCKADEQNNATPVQEPVWCGHCNGSGRMVRDPDIGTDQECFVCDGAGVPAAPVQEYVGVKPCWYESKEEKMCPKCGQVHAGAIFSKAKPAQPAPVQEPDDSDINQIHEANAQVRYETWTPPKQPAPVQEPVGVFVEDDDIGYVRLIPHQQMKLKDGDKLYTTPPDVDAIIALVRADEREACAKVCEEHQFASIGLAAAIRARGNT